MGKITTKLKSLEYLDLKKQINDLSDRLAEGTALQKAQEVKDQLAATVKQAAQNAKVLDSIVPPVKGFDEEERIRKLEKIKEKEQRFLAEQDIPIDKVRTETFGVPMAAVNDRPEAENRVAWEKEKQKEEARKRFLADRANQIREAEKKKRNDFIDNQMNAESYPIMPLNQIKIPRKNQRATREEDRIKTWEGSVAILIFLGGVSFGLAWACYFREAVQIQVVEKYVPSFANIGENNVTGNGSNN